MFLACDPLQPSNAIHNLSSQTGFAYEQFDKIVITSPFLIIW